MFVVVSMLLFALVDVDSGLTIVLFALGMAGAGIGVANPALTALVANAVDERDLGVAGAMQQLMNQMGAVLGSVVMTTVQQATVDGGVAQSYHQAFRVATAVAVIAAILALFVRSTPRDAGA